MQPRAIISISTMIRHVAATFLFAQSNAIICSTAGFPQERTPDSKRRSAAMQEVPALFAGAVRYAPGDAVATAFGPGRVLRRGDGQPTVVVRLDAGATLYAQVRGWRWALGVFALDASLRGESAGR